MMPTGATADSAKILFAEEKTLGPVEKSSVTALSAASATASRFITAISAVTGTSSRPHLESTKRARW
jgi:hypothetical protein